MEKTAIELFAGVGGFRVGLNDIKDFDATTGRANENGNWKFVWANQWEPSTSTQHAYECYALRFGKEDASNKDISLVDKKNDIPDHTLLTGGFPCQDYSVAHPKNSEAGIEGKKGVLWWQINDILLAKKPPFVLLENVDRLLKAPSKLRGQAFGIIIRCFCDAGYGVQWRVINAADYGHAQRRRRIFIFAFKKSTKYFKQFAKHAKKDAKNAILNDLMFSAGFPCAPKNDCEVTKGNIGEDVYKDLVSVSDKFAFPFGNAGYCLDHEIHTMDVVSTFEGAPKTLGECLDCDNVPEFCHKASVEKFRYLKGGKRITRTAKNGHEYVYSEGPIAFPDYLDRPGRTMLTSEGTVNRSSHFILDPVTNRYRILTPVECERLDEFPDNWTNTKMTQRFRYFIAGNALVTGLIRTMGESIEKIIDAE